MNYRDIITIEPGKRGGKPCIRGLRYPVETLLELLSSGMTFDEIKFPQICWKNPRNGELNWWKPLLNMMILFWKNSLWIPTAFRKTKCMAC